MECALDRAKQVGTSVTAPTKLHYPFTRNPPKRHHRPTRNPPKRNCRGGACVPARTSAQRRFHTQIYLRITYHARGLNDGCALAGRHGRAHRHRPYQTPSYFSVQSAHNQCPLRPRSCKTILHLEMNERNNITIVSGTFIPFITCRCNGVAASHH